MVTQERLVEFPGGSENSRDHRRMAELRLIIIAEIGRRAGPEAVREAKALLDRAEATPSGQSGKESISYVDNLLSLTAPFIREAPSEHIMHCRMLAASHLLARLISQEIESQEDEFISSRLEDLQERLHSLERIELTNPSVEAGLARIYEGLMELANTLGLTTFEHYSLRGKG